MNKPLVLVIPIAGSSTRYFNAGFKLHKAFLPLGRTFILDTIIASQYHRCTDIIVVCTREQAITYSYYLSLISSSYPKVRIIEIASHSEGPTRTLYDGLLTVDLEPSNAMLVHYCDFIVDDESIDYQDSFKKSDIVAPTFIGFHPASFGLTKYAYLRLDESGYMIDLREKESFTSDRVNEPASTGIYGFSSISLFMMLAKKLLNEPELWVNGESYTSLCLPIARSEGIKVYGIEVSQFICLGTPEDYLQHQYWDKAYKDFFENDIASTQSYDHLITAAGLGSRFKDAGFTTPKIFLEFQGKTLLEQVASSFKSQGLYIITLNQYLREVLSLLGSTRQDVNVIGVDAVPESQLSSLLLLSEKVASGNSLIVSSADYWFNFDPIAFDEFLNLNSPDVVIFSTEWDESVHASVPNYGFALADESGKVLRINEKQHTLDDNSMLKNLVIGSFWFKSTELISQIDPVYGGNGEVYIASSLGQLTNAFKVMIYPVKTWISLGTPYELTNSTYWFRHLKRLYSMK